MRRQPREKLPQLRHRLFAGDLQQPVIVAQQGIVEHAAVCEKSGQKQQREDDDPRQGAAEAVGALVVATAYRLSAPVISIFFDDCVRLPIRSSPDDINWPQLLYMPAFPALLFFYRISACLTSSL